ncbi:MAG: glycosyltransferase family 39 protein, partial [Anaerolineae bacterium]|nr:glycosyltransferase family 39 protein [Anaerolineae bacterium]MDW8072394.1 glycosyltransferase family 39 protein [Anaerolineae bacterium]
MRAWSLLLLWYALGVLWGEVLLNGRGRVAKLVFGLGFGYAYAICSTLLLAYLPGHLPSLAEVVGLDLLALVALAILVRRRFASLHFSSDECLSRSAAFLLAGITLVGAVFRFTGLGYSEFQGDEALVMLAAADMLEGHEDVLFLRSKGPAEVLLPAALWGLSGTIDEATARLPFALAGSFVPLLGFLLATSLSGNQRMAVMIGILTSALLALNGFMVAFSRIVQYQVLVVLLGGLGLWCSWQWRRDGKVRWLMLCALFVGSALLAHYDGLTVLPAIIYVITTAWGRQTGREGKVRYLVHIAIASALLCFVAGLFYLPYVLDVQAVRTGDYLGGRIGSTLVKNNLTSFQHFNIFYTSFYYYALTGLLVLIFLIRASQNMYGLGRLPWVSRWFPLLLGLIVVALLCRPEILRVPAIDFAFVPFTLLFVGALSSAALCDGQRAMVVWLAVPFLGYNFMVALPLTHIYTIVPAWTLLAGTMGVILVRPVMAPPTVAPWNPWAARLAVASSGIVAVLLAGYLTLAYLRQDVRFVSDWPRSQSPLYWTPYASPPPTGFFGFPHRSGWKTVGALYTSGQLQGDYGSNEEPDITAWYTRRASRACDVSPEYYFIASDVVDVWPVEMPRIHREYERFAEIELPHGRGLVVYRTRPAGVPLGSLGFDSLADAFDRTAVPSAFVRSAPATQRIEVDLGGIIRLMGFELDTQRAYPEGRLTVTLYWQALSTPKEDYHVFVHLAEGTTVWAQS